ncbi:MAG: preprotein translocase subunit SecE [Ruminococcaceae bacterium]|nr:preprotein translocase subunit SecE [Oscillospiraceae bacterium]
MKNENVQVEEVAASAKAKKVVKKENFFKRIWKKLVKLCKDTKGEMKKVVWTPKSELWKNTKLVLFSVVAVSLAIAVVDTAFTYLFTTIAGLIG